MTRTNERPLLLTVCVNPDCRWAMPSYMFTLLDSYEGDHSKPCAALPEWSGHDVFKRIKVYENGAPEVFE